MALRACERRMRAPRVEFREGLVIGGLERRLLPRGRDVAACAGAGREGPLMRIVLAVTVLADGGLLAMLELRQREVAAAASVPRFFRTQRLMRTREWKARAR